MSETINPAGDPRPLSDDENPSFQVTEEAATEPRESESLGQTANRAQNEVEKKRKEDS